MVYSFILPIISESEDVDIKDERSPEHALELDADEVGL